MVLRTVGALIETRVQRGTLDVVVVVDGEGDFRGDLEVDDFGVARVDGLDDHRVQTHRRLGWNRDLGGELAFGIHAQDGLGGDGVTVAQQFDILAGLEAAAGDLGRVTGVDGGVGDRNAAFVIGVDRVGQATGLYTGTEGQGCQCDGQGNALHLTAGTSVNGLLFHSMNLRYGNGTTNRQNNEQQKTGITNRRPAAGGRAIPCRAEMARSRGIVLQPLQVRNLQGPMYRAGV